MTREEFANIARREGYGEPKMIQFEPLSRSALHSHDKISFVYVMSGTFILNTAEGAPTYLPGETCILQRDVEHAEEAGPEGATILVARR